eukprot:19677-Heterococcus_DN1.PRE.1
MKECERIVAAWGCPAIYLKVQAKNPAGVALYERLGYHQARPADDKLYALRNPGRARKLVGTQPLQKFNVGCKGSMDPSTCRAWAGSTRRCVLVHAIAAQGAR